MVVLVKTDIPTEQLHVPGDSKNDVGNSLRSIVPSMKRQVVKVIELNQKLLELEKDELQGCESCDRLAKKVFFFETFVFVLQAELRVKQKKVLNRPHKKHEKHETDGTCEHFCGSA